MSVLFKFKQFLPMKSKIAIRQNSYSVVHFSLNCVK
nr:DNA replication licensing factor mcm4 B [Hymenolepis microstoma]